MQPRATLQQQDQQLTADDDRRRDREELHQRQRLNEAMRSGKPELERPRLTFARFGQVTHDDGRRFRLARGEIVDAQFAGWDAWFIDPFGHARFLERLPGGPR